MNLVEFLLARIAEDERVARSVQEVEPKSAARIFTSLSAPTGTVEMSPARVLAECEAKRRVVAIAQDQIRLTDSPAVHWDNWGDMAHQTLAAVALPYADHPDYDEAWRP